MKNYNFILNFINPSRLVYFAGSAEVPQPDKVSAKPETPETDAKSSAEAKTKETIASGRRVIDSEKGEKRRVKKRNSRC